MSIPDTLARRLSVAPWTRPLALVLLAGLLAGAPLSRAQGLSPAAPPAHPLQDALLYFVLTDRFEDGDPANNTGGLPASLGAGVHGYSPFNYWYYQGGDLAGLRQRLDYLEGLGVTHLWLTPVFRNQFVQGSSAGYHGYWILDFLNVDPHLGTLEDLQGLAADLGQRGMGLFLDIVANHTADVITTQENQSSYRPLTQPPYTPRVPPGLATAKEPAWLNDPVHYHNRGNSTFSGESSLFGDFVGLDDLDTAQPAVVDGMIGIYTEWLRRLPLAGFRIDTVKHVHVDFWRSFAPALRAAARELGHPHFFQFGEVFSGDVRFLSEFSTHGQLDATLDFGFAYAARDFVSRGRPASGLAAFFAQDDWYRSPVGGPHLQPTFLENHDGGMGRWTAFLREDNPGLTEAQLLKLHQLGHGLLLLARGIPVLYYGTEQGFAGKSDPDALARETLFPSQVAAYNALDLLGTPATTADANFDPTHPLYQAIAEVAALREEHRALRRGAMIPRATGQAALFAFSRIDREELVEYLVILNNDRGQSRSATLSTATPGARFGRLYDSDRGPLEPGTESLEADGGGQLTVTLAPLSFQVLRSDRPLPEGGTPSLHFTRLSDQAGLSFVPLVRDWLRFPGRAEIEVTAEGLDHGEVTFAYIRSSEPQIHRLIGTDDSPPYRVHLALPGDLGTDETLTLLAVADTLRGKRAEARVSGIRPGPGPAWLVHLYRENGDFSGWQLRVSGPGLQPPDVPLLRPFTGQTDPDSAFAWAAVVDPSLPVDFNLLGPGGEPVFPADLRAIPALSPQIFLNPDHERFFTTAAAAARTIRIHLRGLGGQPPGGHRLTAAQGPESQPLWSTPELVPAGVDDDGPTFILDTALTGPLIRWNEPLSLEVRSPNGVHASFMADLGQSRRFWIDLAGGQIHSSEAAARREVWIHYNRPDGDYGTPASGSFTEFWGLHVWDGAAQPNAGWTSPLRPEAFSPFGPQFRIPLSPQAPGLAYLLHRGDVKDPGPDQFLDPLTHGHEVWQLAGADPQQPYVFSRPAHGFTGRTTNMFEAASRLVPRWAGLGRLEFPSLPGLLHQIEQSPDLREWTPWADPFVGTGDWMSVEGENNPAPLFLRLRVAE